MDYKIEDSDKSDKYDISEVVEENESSQGAGEDKYQSSKRQGNDFAFAS